MYNLQPAAAALHQGSINAFTSITALLLDSSARALDICSAARQELLANLGESASNGSLPKLDASQTTDALHRHSLALTQESLEALIALQEETLRFFESHSHNLSHFLTHSIEKAGKGLPTEVLPAVNLFQKSVTDLDNTLVSLAETTVQTASEIEEKLVEKAVAGAQPASNTARRKSAA